MKRNDNVDCIQLEKNRSLDGRGVGRPVTGFVPWVVDNQRRFRYVRDLCDSGHCLPDYRSWICCLWMVPVRA